MPFRKVVAALLFAAVCVASERSANAFCRTLSCKLPPSWSPTGGCLPPQFGSGCPSSTPPGAKVVPLWWRSACVTYDVQKSASRWVDYATAAQLVDSAFAKWTAATCPADGAGVTRVSITAHNRGPVACDQVGYNSDAPNQNVILFRDTAWLYSDASNTLGLTTVTFEADTGELYDADTEINGTVPLSVGDPTAPGSYDLESIITHEMGHFLGLAHSGVSSATMYAQYSPGSISMRTLTDDDAAGLCSIYPPNGMRNVDPTVAPSGAIAEDPCVGDGTPRHGFSSQCREAPAKAGCAIAVPDVAPRPGPGPILAVLASLGSACLRRRSPKCRAADPKGTRAERA